MQTEDTGVPQTVSTDVDDISLLGEEYIDHDQSWEADFLGLSPVHREESAAVPMKFFPAVPFQQVKRPVPVKPQSIQVNRVPAKPLNELKGFIV
jgi:hypothetical protein